MENNELKDLTNEYYQNEIDLDLNRLILSGDNKGRGKRQNSTKFWINKKLEKYGWRL